MILAACFSLFAFGPFQEVSPTSDVIQVIAVPRSVESENIELQVAFPQENEVVSKPVWVQFRLGGFALGANSVSSRTAELVNSTLGQTVHVIIDEHPYFPISGSAIDPFDDSGNYYFMSYRFEIPYKLNPGPHVLRLFPAKSFGESLKDPGTFVSLNFYVGEEKEGAKNLMLPYLSYNEPSPLMHYKRGVPVLLDFYVSNATLSPDGYQVRLFIDGKEIEILSSWQPYYIYGLRRGKHTIEIELIDEKKKIVSGPFSKASQSIMVY